MNIEITCPQCEGTGKVELSSSMRETLNFMPLNKGLSAGDILPLLTDNIGVTGVSNRLANLFLLGLVTRKREGKFWLYTRTSPRKATNKKPRR